MATHGLRSRFAAARAWRARPSYFEPPPPPDAGTTYRGLRLIFDCDRDDYPRVGVSVHSNDKSGLTVDMAPERGQQEYRIETGFRREKHPARWDQISYVMLTLEGSRHPLDLVYRQQRISVAQVAGTAPPADDEADAAPGGGGRAADRFGEPLLSPRPKEVT